jgi:hypothetical protein
LANNRGETQGIDFSDRSDLKREIASTTDVTKDWKTYTNTQYGLSFKYPQNWGASAVEITGDNIYLSDPSMDEATSNSFSDVLMTIHRAANPKELNIQKWYEESVFKTEVQIIGQPTIGGMPALKTSQTGMNETIVMYVGKGNSVFSIQLNQGKEYADIFDQILSTFKFTSITTDTTKDFLYKTGIIPQEKLVSTDDYGNVNTSQVMGGPCTGCAESPSYECKDTKKLAEKIKISPVPTKLAGGGETRYALVCGNNYWILSVVETIYNVYGPFIK